MSNNTYKQEQHRCGLLDMLDDKSLNNLRRFGHIYRDQYSGRIRMRVFKDKKNDVLTADVLNKAIKDVWGSAEKPAVNNIRENGCNEFFKKFAPTLTSPLPIFGVPVYSNSYIPKGEIWMMHDNKLIQRFKVF